MSGYDAKATEKEVLRYWEEKQIPLKAGEHRKGKKKFFLLDGPPYANNEAHVGHVKTTACKDIWSRFKQMQGFDSLFIPGFDCHGLPIEVMVEKELGIKNKQEIESIGVANFDAKCLEKVLNTEKKWIAYYKRLGAWRAFFTPYFTYKDYYLQSGWWTAKQLYEKGLMYEGERTIHWCPHCETALSGYEVSDSYKDVEDPSIYVKFKLKNSDESLLVWTTTPWTLLSNVAIVVAPEEEYAKVRVNDEIVILAEKRAEEVMKECGIKDFEIISKLKGKGLVGKEYEPLLQVPQQEEIMRHASAGMVYASISVMTHKKYKKHVMHNDDKEKKEKKEEEQEEFEDFVTMGEGSGLVHCAPGHGQTDFFLGKHYSLPIASPINEQGKFNEMGGMFAGKYAKKADPEIIELLKKEGKVLHASRKMHRATLCWRCKTPLIFRMSRQIYLRIDSLKEEMIKQNEGVKWMPSFGKEKFHNWLAERTDWCISQQRYWGIPIPLWICGKCNERVMVGSIKELKEKALNAPEKIEDLHRHTVDSILLRCKCGGEMKRIKDIFNVWYDSGIAPWASLGYPYENKELFGEVFPVDLVNESQDQIRGWFDSLMFTSVATFGKSPYKAVSLMGWVLDEKGEKMSKSLGNVIGAMEAIEKLGGDAIRLYYCSEVAPWEVQKFSFEKAKEAQRTLNILWNMLAFYQTYGIREAEGGKPSIEDRWLLSRLNSLTNKVTDHLEEFEFHLAGREITKFIVDDFSRWYVKLSRDRMGLEAEEEERKAASHTMRSALLELSRIMAPITPFITEKIFSELNGGGESVHYSSYPLYRKEASDEKLEMEMEIAMQVTEACNSARQSAGIKLRWPLRRVVIESGEEIVSQAVNGLNELLTRSLNCKVVEFVGKASDLQLSELKGFEVKEFQLGKIYVDKERDGELLNESIFRELVRAVQEARKKGGLVVTQKILLSIRTDGKMQEYLEKHLKELEKEVGALRIGFSNKPQGDYEAKVEEEGVKIEALFSKR